MVHCNLSWASSYIEAAMMPQYLSYYEHMISIGAKVEHPSFGEGVVFGEEEKTWTVYFRDHGEEDIAKAYDGLKMVSPSTVEVRSIGLEDVVAAVENVFEQYYEDTRHIEMAERWEGGNLILKPGNEDTQSKEVPIDTFFHKIVMVRERLRVLEQNINNHEKLDDQDRLHLQQYITRAYGSLTTFNILFASKNDHFKGQSSK